MKSYCCEKARHMIEKYFFIKTIKKDGYWASFLNIHGENESVFIRRCPFCGGMLVPEESEEE